MRPKNGGKFMKKMMVLLVIMAGAVFLSGCSAVVGGVAGGLFGGHPGTAQEGFEAGLERDFGITPSMREVVTSVAPTVEASCGNYQLRCTKDYYDRKFCDYVWISRPCRR
jgi:hypothetical protein